VSNPSMVDWDQVERLREKGWDWKRIAQDPKVGFHADSGVSDEGRALRALYYQRRSRAERKPSPKSAKRAADEEAKRSTWTMARIGYLVAPLLGIWFLVAYLAPSPVGLILPAIPWLALGFAVAAFILAFGLWRAKGARWSKLYRTTLTYGIVTGLALVGITAAAGILIFGCPYLPPAASLTTQSASGQPSGNSELNIPPWTSGSMHPWQDGGKPVLYFYGASWCPYCSAGSWAIYKALSEFGSLSGQYTSYSSSSDVYAGTPEMVLGNAQLSSSTISFQVSEDLGGVDGTFPGTSNCYQQAYVAAYSGSSIPFVVVNGQYIHGGSQLVAPTLLSTWSYGSSGGTGATTVLTSVNSESGQPWNVVQVQAWWIMAFLVKSTGDSVSQLATQYGWSSTTAAGVSSDYNQIV
jgi:thiol-disulfide isomerase/thioredoxin